MAAIVEVLIVLQASVALDIEISDSQSTCSINEHAIHGEPKPASEMGIPIHTVLEMDVFFDDFATYCAFGVCRSVTVAASHAAEVHIEAENEVARLEIHAPKRAADETVNIPHIAQIQPVGRGFALDAAGVGVDVHVGLYETRVHAAIDARPVIGDIFEIVAGICRRSKHQRKYSSNNVAHDS